MVDIIGVKKATTDSQKIAVPSKRIAIQYGVAGRSIIDGLERVTV